MARISNKGKALAYAADKGIILTMEDVDAGDELGAGAIEVWSLDAHLSESGSDCHTYFARGNTEPRAWADALAYMERLTECGDDCPCRDNGQDDGQDQDDTDRDQDQDTDQDRDQDQDDTLTVTNHQDHYQSACCDSDSVEPAAGCQLAANFPRNCESGLHESWQACSV